jgi:hypothetical protein
VCPDGAYAVEAAALACMSERKMRAEWSRFDEPKPYAGCVIVRDSELVLSVELPESRRISLLYSMGPGSCERMITARAGW